MYKAVPALGLIVLAGCTPTPKPLIPVEQAMAECRARIASPVETQVEIGVGVNNHGKVRSGVAIGMDIDLAAKNHPEDTYYDCVVSKSGTAPTEPLYPAGA